MGGDAIVRSVEWLSLVAARRYLKTHAAGRGDGGAKFLDSWRFERLGHGEVELRWEHPAPGRHVIATAPIRLYARGDVAETRDGPPGADPVLAANAAYFDGVVAEAITRAGGVDAVATGEGPGSERHRLESDFHDRWAASEDPSRIDVRGSAEACTSPELRHIRAVLGDLKGRTLLDVGCGLGEAGVYFAMEGADVTATDLSPGMLTAAAALAAHNGVSIRTHQAAAESLNLEAGRKFDVIYAGNLLHHVDVERTLKTLRPHLAPGGLLVTWDPVKYNPVINVYRRMAAEVRTPDEHPLGLSDLATFRRLFGRVEVRWFWLTTLVVFLAMALQRRNPNKERYWKKVVEEADRWAWLYRPLERLDRLLLRLLPFLGPLCWNVVIVAREPNEVP